MPKEYRFTLQDENKTQLNWPTTKRLWDAVGREHVKRSVFIIQALRRNTDRPRAKLSSVWREAKRIAGKRGMLLSRVLDDWITEELER